MSRILTVAAAQSGPVNSEDPNTSVPAAIEMIDKAAAARVDILTTAIRSIDRQFGPDLADASL